MQKIILSLICLSSLSVFQASANDYRCELSNHKTVTIEKNATGQLLYRYGTASKTELTLPGQSKDESVSYASLPIAAGSADYLRFTRGDYSYVIFDGTGQNWGPYTGLVVWQGKKIISQHECQNSPDELMSFISPNTPVIQDDQSQQYGYSFIAKLSHGN